MEDEGILIDATETLIERTKRVKRGIKNSQSAFYFVKKRRVALKSQLVVDKKTKQVICKSFTSSRRHDFRLFKESGAKISTAINY
jgi:hypothetical protein